MLLVDGRKAVNELVKVGNTSTLKNVKQSLVHCDVLSTRFNVAMLIIYITQYMTGQFGLVVNR